MRGNALGVCWFVAFLLTIGVRPAPAQQEVYHPGETYDSLQAGQDAYRDAEIQRRALIARQLMIENQIILQNTRADSQDKYRPVAPDFWGAQYHSYVRQPTGHVKIWTGRLGYIYKPVYASPQAESPRPAIAAGHRGTVLLPPRPLAGPEMRPGNVPSAAESLNSPPPPPKPSIPPPDHPNPRPAEGPDLNPPNPDSPKAGQEI